MINTIHRLRNSTLTRNTLWMLVGNGLKLVIQAAYFILVARSLGPAEYGAFVALTAVTGILAPFVGLGTTNLIVKSVSRNSESFSVCWGNGLFVTVITGVAGIVLILFCPFILPAGVNHWILVLVALADLLFQRISDLCSFAFGAVERFRETATMNVLFNIARLIGLISLTTVVSHPTIRQWAFVYLTASALVTLVGCIWITRSIGRPSLHLGRLRAELVEGTYFSAGQSAQTVYNDIDKSMLAKLGDLSAAGIYGAAYRLIDVTLVPIRSLVAAAYPGVFRAAESGILGSVRYIKRMMVHAMVYASVAFIVLMICAPVIPHVLGHEYARTVIALRWLAFLPFLKAMQFFLADALTGAGYQGLRTLLQALTAGINILLNLWIIPAYSWRGAAWSSIASDLLLSLMLATAIAIISRKQRNLQGCLTPAMIAELTPD
jgi:O-antigen/teichoic acid export membrane protein